MDGEEEQEEEGDDGGGGDAVGVLGGRGDGHPRLHGAGRRGRKGGAAARGRRRLGEGRREGGPEEGIVWGGAVVGRLGYLRPFPPSNSPQTYYLLYFTTSLQKIPLYNSFSPTIPLISIPSIYYHSLTNYLFIVF